LEIKPKRFIALPLSINENDFQPTSSIKSSDQTLSVLFVGTLVPLHNIGLLCEAISKLDENLPVSFTIIGDGQDGTVLEHFLASRSDDSPVKCRWHRNWFESPELAQAIANADLCIGILGNTGKSQRVWPFKNYLYLACGKPLVTASTTVSNRLQNISDKEAFFEVDTSSSDALTRLLGEVIQNPSLLEPVGSSAASFYQENLSGQVIAHKLNEIVRNNQQT